MKKTLLLLFLIHATFAISQPSSTPDTSEPVAELGPEEFVILKHDYAVMTKSESYRLVKQNFADFTAKLNGVANMVLQPHAAWLTWITNNLSRTKFTSVKEADALRSSGIALVEKNHALHKHVYENLRKASKAQRVSLLKAEREGHFR